MSNLSFKCVKQVNRKYLWWRKTNNNSMEYDSTRKYWFWS